MMPRIPYCVLAVVLLPIRVAPAAAEETTPRPVEYYSANREHVLCLTPDQNWRERQGWCLAELYKANGSEKALVWKRYLINNAAPAEVLVADSGKYVVTLGDWGKFDTVPLVVYGARGEMLKLFTAETHFPDMDVIDGDTSVFGDYSRRALMFFGPNERTLFIDLVDFQTFVIWLESGEVMDSQFYMFAKPAQLMSNAERDALEAFVRQRPAELAMDYLQSTDARLREIGAMVAEEMGLCEAVPRLQGLLEDKPQNADPAVVEPSMSTIRVDPAAAARRALNAIAEEQRQAETGTFVPREVDDAFEWARMLDRGQRANNPEPLKSFLRRWQVERHGISPDELQKKPDLEQAIYAMFPAFFLPVASEEKTGNLIIQDEVEVRLVEGNLADDYRRETEDGTSHAMERPVISRFTITDFCPSLTVEDKNVLYLDKFHVDVLARFLTGKHGFCLADTYWEEPNGIDEKWFDGGPFTRRLDYLNQSLHILRGHWGSGWHFETHPLISSVVLNQDLRTAVIIFRRGWGGGIALLEREDTAWRVKGREFTWEE